MIVQENETPQEEGSNLFNWNELEPSPSNSLYPR